MHAPGAIFRAARHSKPLPRAVPSPSSALLAIYRPACARARFPALICLLQRPPRVCPARAILFCVLHIHSRISCTPSASCLLCPSPFVAAVPRPAHSTVGHTPLRPPSLRCVATTHGVHTHSVATHLKLGGQKHLHIFMWLLCPLPNPASHQSASSPSDLLHGARLCKQPAARPSQRQPSSAARTGSVQQPVVTWASSPQFERHCACRHTPPHLPERAHAAAI